MSFSYINWLHFIGTLGALLFGCGGDALQSEDAIGSAQDIPLVGVDSQDQMERADNLAVDLAVEATQLRFCNGSSHLCERRYDEVSYGCTHNGMSSEEEGWWGPNQHYAVPTQLKDGIRAFMLDTVYHEGESFLCHGPCILGSKPLADGLSEFEAFLAEHPDNVVTIIFESYITAEDTLVAFEESGLAKRTYAHIAGTPWPTLGEMIDAGTTVVVLADSGGGSYPWYHPVWDEAWETHWSNNQIDDFDCDPNRGSPDNPLFILNHFLTDPIGKPELALLANSNPFFKSRVQQCMEESGQLPNYLVVDFYHVGDLFTVLDLLNAPGTPR